jgi:hypothetical protein
VTAISPLGLIGNEAIKADHGKQSEVAANNLSDQYLPSTPHRFLSAPDHFGADHAATARFAHPSL